MPLLNVRLDDQDARKAAALRGAGVPISALVRGAIRTEYDRRVTQAAGRRRPSAIVTEILASLPDPPDAKVRPFVATDRRAVRRHIAARLKRSRS